MSYKRPPKKVLGIFLKRYQCSESSVDIFQSLAQQMPLDLYPAINTSANDNLKAAGTKVGSCGQKYHAKVILHARSVVVVDFSVAGKDALQNFVLGNMVNHMQIEMYVERETDLAKVLEAVKKHMEVIDSVLQRLENFRQKNRLVWLLVSTRPEIREKHVDLIQHMEVCIRGFIPEVYRKINTICLNWTHGSCNGVRSPWSRIVR